MNLRRTQQPKSIRKYAPRSLLPQTHPALYRQLADTIPEHAIFIVHHNGIVADWNPGAQRLYGYHAEEIVGKPVQVLIPPDRLSEEDMLFNRMKRGEQVDQVRTVRQHKSGRQIDVLLSMSPIRGKRGEVVGAIKIVRNIGEETEQMTALRDNEQKLRAILRTAVDAIITIDERGIIESANPATHKLFGYAESELLGRNVSILMPDPHRSQHDGYLRNYLRTGKARIIGVGREVSGLRKDGTIFPLNLSISEVLLNGRRIFTGIVHDLSGRRQLEKQILDAGSNEQRRIGQDLHDGLCQELVGLGLSAGSLAMELESKSPREAAVAKELGDAIRRVATQARQLAHGLNPVDVKAGGLPDALKNLAQKVSSAFKIRCAFATDAGALVLDETIATHLYRIAQEATSNAIKHGKASRVKIRLTLSKQMLTLLIEDNGVGFGKSGYNANSSTNGHAAAGMGLQTMNYRARMIGGSFAIQSKSKGGALVSCILPHAARTNPAGKKTASK